MIHRERRSTSVWIHSDALADAVALIAFPVVIGLVGSWVDAKLGTGRVFMFVLVAVAIVGVFATAYYRYLARIAEHDAGKPWTRKRGR